MKYDNISKGIFISRPNRFIAEVNIDGKCERVHVKNTGRCKELLIPDCEVYESTGRRKGKDRKQQVDVYFNFIGNCQVPQKVDMEKMV